jgi:hypothetical protein
MNSFYTSSNDRCGLHRAWTPGLLVVCLAGPFVSATTSLAEASDDGYCLLQTHTEVTFKPKQSPFSTQGLQGSFEMPDLEKKSQTTSVKNYDHRSTLTSKESKSSLISTARKSHVLASLLDFAASESVTDSGQQGFLIMGVLIAVGAVVGTLAVCLYMEPSKDYAYPVAKERIIRGPSPPPPPPRQSVPGFPSSTRTSETGGHRSQTGQMLLQRELRSAEAQGAQSPISTGASSFKASPVWKAHEAEPMRYSTSVEEEPLVSSLVVSRGEAAYLLPDLGHMSRPVEAFDILNQSGTPVLGVVVNDGSEDPGILLHAPRTADGAGLPLAFVGTSMALRNSGNLPIARPCVDKKHGESFASLHCDLQGGYSVRKDGHLIMRFEGDLIGRTIWIYDKASNQAIGSTRPCGEAFGQMRFEVHVATGKDAGLAILCLLAIGRLEHARATIQSSSQGSRDTLHPDPGVGGGAHGSLISLGALQGM